MIGRSKASRLRARLRNQYALLLMLAPAVVLVLIFSYGPMYGVSIAFLDYNPAAGILKSSFKGLQHFRAAFSDSIFYTTMRNTLAISTLSILFSFPVPILFAVILNEVPFRKYTRVIQTASSLPHFFSTAVVGTMWLLMFDSKGIVVQILNATGLMTERASLWSIKEVYWPLLLIVGTWKNIGWNAIIYLAALSGVNPELYEAARVDGARRVQLIRHITLPSLKGTIVVMLILSVGGLFRGNFDWSYIFGNIFNHEYSYVIEYYTLRAGFERLQYSFSAAVGLFQSLASLLLVLGANRLARRVADQAIF